MTAADWTAIAAVATAFMAVATSYLAINTRSLAKETKSVAVATLMEAEAVERQVEQVERQLVLSAEALRVSVQPWLEWQPYLQVEAENGPMGAARGGLYLAGTHSSFEAREEDTRVVGAFTIRNVGSGIALLDMSKSHIYVQNNDLPIGSVHPKVITPILAPGECVDIEFEIPAKVSPDRTKMTLVQLAGGTGDQVFAVEVAYGDALGNPSAQAKFKAHRKNGAGSWSVFEVEYNLADGRKIVARRFGN